MLPIQFFNQWAEGAELLLQGGGGGGVGGGCHSVPKGGRPCVGGTDQSGTQTNAITLII